MKCYYRHALQLHVQLCNICNELKQRDSHKLLIPPGCQVVDLVFAPSSGPSLVIPTISIAICRHHPQTNMPPQTTRGITCNYHSPNPAWSYRCTNSCSPTLASMMSSTSWSGLVVHRHWCQGGSICTGGTGGGAPPQSTNPTLTLQDAWRQLGTQTLSKIAVLLWAVDCGTQCFADTVFPWFFGWEVHRSTFNRPISIVSMQYVSNYIVASFHGFKHPKIKRNGGRSLRRAH